MGSTNDMGYKTGRRKNRKIGWFKKVENQKERNLFIKEYINNNFENRLRNELGLTVPSSEVLLLQSSLSKPVK